MLPLIIVGFTMAIMTTLGIALLILGEVPFVAGQRIPAGRSRLIGAILLGFAPLAIGVLQLLYLLFEREAIEGPVVIWSVFGVCWFFVFVLLFRVMVPKQEHRQTTNRAESATKKNPFGGPDAPNESMNEALPWMESEPLKKPTPKNAAKPVKTPSVEPAKKTPAKKPSKPAADESNPFDFN